MAIPRAIWEGAFTLYGVLFDAMGSSDELIDVRELENFSRWRAGLSPSAREAQAVPSVSPVNEGKN